ncbi:MAG: flagellar hook capping FlgD N-terminal domain-containing protein [Myxococcaceae bacterium]
MPNAIGSSTTTDPNATQQTAATGSRALGKNEFLKLLTTQLANQDPLAPTDNQAFIAQLAQFSSVEQAEAMNSRLDALLVAQAAGNQTAIANLVGKDVIFKSSTCELGTTGPASIGGELSANAAIANAIITDENGRKIRTISLSDVKAGDVKFSWDGKDDSGAAVKPGTYKVELTAADQQGAKIAISQRGRGHASSVSFEDGIPELVVNGQKVKMSDILQIAEGTSSSGAFPGTSLSLADLLNSTSGN